MKMTIAFACTLAWVCSLDAQVSAKVDHSPGGLEQITVRNGSKLDLVAFVVRAKPVAGLPTAVPALTFFDALDGDRDALAPGEERGWTKVPEPGGRRVFEGPVTVSGIFADGSTAGDAELLRMLLSYRSNRLAAIENVLDMLMQAGQRNIPRDQLVAQFKKMADGARRWYMPEEQRVAATVYASMVDKLVNLPEQEPGAPFAPAAFVRGEVAALSRDRAALLASQPSLSAALAR
jgi:hypothetical protein